MRNQITENTSFPDVVSPVLIDKVEGPVATRGKLATLAGRYLLVREEEGNVGIARVDINSDDDFELILNPVRIPYLGIPPIRSYYYIDRHPPEKEIDPEIEILLLKGGIELGQAFANSHEKPIPENSILAHTRENMRAAVNMRIFDSRSRVVGPKIGVSYDLLGRDGQKVMVGNARQGYLPAIVRISHSVPRSGRYDPSKIINARVSLEFADGKKYAVTLPRKNDGSIELQGTVHASYYEIYEPAGPTSPSLSRTAR